MSERIPSFPFTAIVGNDDLKRALLLNLVDPRVGGVLIRGDRGTAKSTVVRGLATLLPRIRTREGCPVQCDPEDGPCAICNDAGAIVERAPRVVDLPLGATEDRVVGTIDLGHALSSGERRFEAGVVGLAHRGALYVDEVNLLPDHLVDLLLDVAASGVNVVERDGTSASHPARFILVGTMNPEEGELRPQLLDRFGLVVDVRTPVDAEVRAEVVRRRIAFDTEPRAFLARFAAQEDALRTSIAAARAAAPNVGMPHAMLELIVDLCIEARVDGLRADITLHRASTVLAALAGRVEVTEAEILDAALLVLPHRQHTPRPGTPPPPDVPSMIEARRPSSDDDTTDGSEEDGGTGAKPPPSSDPGEPGADAPDVRGDETGVLEQSRTPSLDERLSVSLPDAAPVRRPGARAGLGEALRGRRVGVQRWDGRSRDLALVPSLVEATRRGTYPVRIDGDSVRMHRRRASSSRLVLLVVDGSASMGAYERMARTKAGLRSILERVRVTRDRVAVQVFRGGRVELLVPPGRNIASARAAIEELPTGGGTPLAAALYGAATLLRHARLERPSESSLLVLVTDGRTRESARTAACDVGTVATTSMVLDTEVGPTRLGRARQIALWLGASYEVLP